LAAILGEDIPSVGLEDFHPYMKAVEPKTDKAKKNVDLLDWKTFVRAARRRKR